jgi:hypothetical protein
MFLYILLNNICDKMRMPIGKQNKAEMPGNNVEKIRKVITFNHKSPFGCQTIIGVKND